MIADCSGDTLPSDSQSAGVELIVSPPIMFLDDTCLHSADWLCHVSSPWFETPIFCIRRFYGSGLYFNIFSFPSMPPEFLGQDFRIMKNLISLVTIRALVSGCRG